ncbi:MULTISPECIES: TonB-dependent siderophore receptor [Variovorax]|uniref:TonB-dependent siderophore receptor n=1 Tax=Variovorax TaxID=34072 RepID=UPI00086EAE21|nr:MULTISPECIES: TonB-dependent siderophore receptor [Variovorax]MBN8754841.1 TonB-dependent siderophore receptor [Variovorax sp.]ODU11767.1 MAG: TonB-dependent receptor [Variovorax sp. SCN 67-85]ODV14870.1 MAG: TonB-dependent receptor [Variovorax sp. SCN 67-20]OJZ05413.1 MAG: TonB-dependent receptor [Variovorax sp. 67-131]UKI05140.1 TonB-dependent siderophore receptor [Variovorax paradoxus]
MNLPKPPLSFSPWQLSPVSRALAVVLFTAACGAQAQQAALREVTVNEGAAAPQADISGFGDVPLRELPISATVIDSQQLRASGARRLADLTQFDASVTDAYNSAGYWDYLTVRGFVLDNRFNYRREGLPISAETSIPLDNKERVEILRGTSGIQAGTSAPGGLVNYVVKRPTEQDLRTVRIETTSRGSLLGAIDLGGRFGENREFGYRINVASENLKPITHDLDGNRNLFSLAADWRITRDSVLEFEIEQSRKTQPSQNGYSLLGSVLPRPVDPRINLNNQPWSQPSVFKALTGTVRFSQAINTDWRWTAQIGQQRLKSDDRLAYAFGCSAEGNYDRYCSDGTFDVYDFRSDNERRTQTAGSLNLKGNVTTGSVKHELGFGLLQSRVRNRFQDQAYNYAGTGNIWGTAMVPANPDATTPQTNRDERSTELSVQDAIRWNDRFTTWLGVRHTRLDRSSIGNDGSNPTSYKQDVTTPWIAASYAIQPGLLAYASWGKGVESQVVPNRISQYSNAGQALPALTSRQWELGLKGGSDAFNWQVAWFDISRPMTNLDLCSGYCEVRNDGRAVHRGLEAGAQWTQGPWRLGGSVAVIDAKRRGSTENPALNGQSPTNVPKEVLRAQAAYRVASVPGLEIAGQLSYEGRRNVLPDGSITLPSWTRVDAVLRYDTKLRGVNTSWTLAVDNLFDRRYWKESPYQFSHVYLFPGAPRTLRLGVSIAL